MTEIFKEDLDLIGTKEDLSLLIWLSKSKYMTDEARLVFDALLALAED